MFIDVGAFSGCEYTALGVLKEWKEKNILL